MEGEKPRKKTAFEVARDATTGRIAAGRAVLPPALANAGAGVGLWVGGASAAIAASTRGRLGVAEGQASAGIWSARRARNAAAAETAPPIDAPDAEGFTRLHRAAANNGGEVAAALALGADPLVVTTKSVQIADVTIPKGSNALHIAAYTGGGDVISVLAGHRAWSQIAVAKNDHFQTPLMIAASRKDGDFVDELFSQGIAPDPADYVVVAQTNDIDNISRYILQERALLEWQVLATPVDKSAAFHTAIGHGHLQAVKLFLEDGISLDAQHEGKSPLLTAALNGKADIIRELLDYAHANGNPTYGQTALHEAIRNRGVNKTAIETLLTDPRIKAAIHVKDNDETPLGLAHRLYVEVRADISVATMTPQERIAANAHIVGLNAIIPTLAVAECMAAPPPLPAHMPVGAGRAMQPGAGVPARSGRESP